MSLDISTETEARLREKAREQGLSVEALLRQLLGEEPGSKRVENTGDLPLWNLGVRSSLQRAEIYEDAR